MPFLKVLLPVLVFGILALAPHQASAATATFFGPIIPPECHCEHTAPDFGCVLQVIENVMNFAISIGVIIFVLVAAYAGLLWMFSPMNPHNREQGRSILMNAVIGLLITLCAWLLVDFVMKTLYNGQYGPWNAILKEGNACLLTITPPQGSGFVNGGLQTGSRVECYVTNPNLYSPGTITAVKENGQTFTVDFDEEETEDVIASHCRSLGGLSSSSGANCPVGDAASMVAFPSNVVENGEAEKATSATVQNFMAMREAAAADGITLVVRDGYRTDAEQVTLWNQNCGSGTCSSPTAKPCSLGGDGSNHNSGQAIDIVINCSFGNTSCNTPAYNWLKAHGAQYNFRNALPNDPVHWSPSGR